MEKIKELVEKQISCIEQTGLSSNNVDLLYKLIDIHKDIENEEYWKKKGEYYMRYRENDYYDEPSFGRRRRDSRGRYMEGGRESYNRRGRYNDGEDMIDTMREHYMAYHDDMSYGAKEEGMESLNKMLEATYEFMQTLCEEASTPQEMELVKKWARKISQL